MVIRSVIHIQIVQVESGFHLGFFFVDFFFGGGGGGTPCGIFDHTHFCTYFVLACYQFTLGWQLRIMYTHCVVEYDISAVASGLIELYCDQGESLGGYYYSVRNVLDGYTDEICSIK